MRKILATASVLFMITMMLPIGSAETISVKYNIPSGANNATCGNPVCAVSTTACLPPDEGVLSDSGDRTVFGPLGFDENNNPDDMVEAAYCGAIRDTNGGAIRMGVSGIGTTCGDCYTNFLVTISDTLPASTMFSFCIITNHQDGRGSRDSFCGNIDPRDPSLTPDDIEDARVEACGSGSVTSVIAGGGTQNNMVAFVFATHVDTATGAVCLGSTGTFTVSAT